MLDFSAALVATSKMRVLSSAALCAGSRVLRRPSSGTPVVRTTSSAVLLPQARRWPGVLRESMASPTGGPRPSAVQTRAAPADGRARTPNTSVPLRVWPVALPPSAGTQLRQLLVGIRLARTFQAAGRRHWRAWRSRYRRPVELGQWCSHHGQTLLQGSLTACHCLMMEFVVCSGAASISGSKWPTVSTCPTVHTTLLWRRRPLPIDEGSRKHFRNQKKNSTPLQLILDNSNCRCVT